MSAKPNDIVMWSHYADAHRGVCLGFSTTSADSPFAAAERVSYQHSRAFELSRRHLDLDMHGLLQLSVRRGLLSKATQWRYEDEWRLIGPPGLREYPHNALVEVVIGHRTTTENQTWLREWITSYAPHVLLRRAQISPGYFDVELDP